MPGEIEPTQVKIEIKIETNIPAGKGCGGLVRLKKGPDLG